MDISKSLFLRPICILKSSAGKCYCHQEYVTERSDVTNIWTKWLYFEQLVQDKGRKYLSPALTDLCQRILAITNESPHKTPAMRKTIPIHDVIINWSVSYLDIGWPHTRKIWCEPVSDKGIIHNHSIKNIEKTIMSQPVLHIFQVSYLLN